MREFFKFVIIYLDDILIFFKTAEEHPRHLEIVLIDYAVKNSTVTLPNQLDFYHSSHAWDQSSGMAKFKWTQQSRTTSSTATEHNQPTNIP